MQKWKNKKEAPRSSSSLAQSNPPCTQRCIFLLVWSSALWAHLWWECIFFISLVSLSPLTHLHSLPISPVTFQPLVGFFSTMYLLYLAAIGPSLALFSFWYYSFSLGKSSFPGLQLPTICRWVSAWISNTNFSLLPSLCNYQPYAGGSQLEFPIATFPNFQTYVTTNHMQMGLSLNFQFQLLQTSKPMCPTVQWIFPGGQHIQSWDPRFPLKTCSSFFPVTMDVTHLLRLWNWRTRDHPRFPFSDSMCVLSDPMNCSLLGSSVRGILQARILECHLGSPSPTDPASNNQVLIISSWNLSQTYLSLSVPRIAAPFFPRFSSFLS